MTPEIIYKTLVDTIQTDEHESGWSSVHYAELLTARAVRNIVFRNTTAYGVFESDFYKRELSKCKVDLYTLIYVTCHIRVRTHHQWVFIFVSFFLFAS